MKNNIFAPNKKRIERETEIENPCTMVVRIAIIWMKLVLAQREHSNGTKERGREWERKAAQAQMK